MTDLVFARDGQALTTSEIVAQGVGIQHKNLLALIRRYQTDFEEFGTPAFETRGSEGTADYQVFAILNEQQATLLVTYCKNTETVRKFKVALVKAFYEMREQLHPTCPAHAQLPPPTLSEQQAYAIMSEVAKRAKNCGAHYQTIYRALKARYQVTRYTNIPSAQFNDAIEFIRNVNLAVPETQPSSKAVTPTKKKTYVVTENFIERQRTFVYHLRYLFREEIDRLIEVMRLMDSPHAAALYDAIHDLNLVGVEEDLARLGFPVQELNTYKHWSSRHIK